MPFTKICETCGNLFDVYGRREFEIQRFCSRTCFDASEHAEPKDAVTKTCEFCQKPFSVKASKATHQRFCSDVCAAKKREESHTDLICKNCGITFHVTRLREHGKIFCGKACTTAYEKIHGRVAGRHSRKIHLTFACKQCGKSFSQTESAVAEYRRKFGKDPLYCSIPCSALGRKADTDAEHTVNCKNCGKQFTRTRRPSGGVYREQQLCSRQCKNEWVSKVYRQKHGLPQMTKRIRKGYVLLRIPAMDGQPTKEVLEHRYVMEQFLGRGLFPIETVHHRRAWDKTTNTMDNLELRTGNHGAGGAVEDLIPWCIEMLETYPMFVTDELKERIKTVIGGSG